MPAFRAPAVVCFFVASFALTAGQARAGDKPLREVIDAQVSAVWKREKITPASRSLMRGKTRILEQTVDQLVALLGIGVGQELLRLFVAWDCADQVDMHAAQKCGVIRLAAAGTRRPGCR